MPAWKRGVMLILHPPHYLWSNSCSIYSFIIYYYMVIKFFLMLTVLIYKKVVYLWSFSPFSFWSKLLLATYTMVLSVLLTLSCVQAFTDTVIPSVWRTFVFFSFLFFKSLNISIIWKQRQFYCFFSDLNVFCLFFLLDFSGSGFQYYVE